jgi:hypothetical protein
VSRSSLLLVALMAVFSLAGCGSSSRLPATSAQGPGSLGGCTDTWTGAGGDHDYTNARDWSGGRAPGRGDFGCIRPGSLVEVHRAPLEQAAGLIIEGTLCVDVPAEVLAVDIYNGAPPGQPMLPAVPGTTDLAPPCPPGTEVSMQGSTPGAQAGSSGAQGGSSPATPSAPSQTQSVPPLGTPTTPPSSARGLVD